MSEVPFEGAAAPPQATAVTPLIFGQPEFVLIGLVSNASKATKRLQGYQMLPRLGQLVRLDACTAAGKHRPPPRTPLRP